MEAPSDFKELLELFNAARVEYLIVGGYALGRHGVVRYTGDLDLLVRPTAANARRVVKALDRFGFGSLGLTEEDFTEPEQVIQLGRPPLRIDILNTLTGVTWSRAAKGRVKGNFGDVAVWFIGRDELAANKRALGRQRDLADLEALAGKASPRAKASPKRKPRPNKKGVVT